MVMATIQKNLKGDEMVAGVTIRMGRVKVEDLVLISGSELLLFYFILSHPFLLLLLHLFLVVVVCLGFVDV